MSMTDGRTPSPAARGWSSTLSSGPRHLRLRRCDSPPDRDHVGEDGRRAGRELESAVRHEVDGLFHVTTMGVSLRSLLPRPGLRGPGERLHQPQHHVHGDHGGIPAHGNHPRAPRSQNPGRRTSRSATSAQMGGTGAVAIAAPGVEANGVLQLSRSRRPRVDPRSPVRTRAQAVE